ncbi:hypothetical protein SAMN05216259_102264 [Actinacidiphila guanduensis]|uniref:Uncharacterized protein n=1 Tax=Actinacidiphila guanduensis TaxID=310781 RepID=A0A1G9XTM9_9ACTN|nr:hypothetical protein SAMN05216259_102264 [Actinacidiphila guanduensis]
MPPPEARIADIRAGLAAAGLRPVRKDGAEEVRIEADVPPDFPPEAWLAVLAALESADRFGLSDGTARGRTVWALVRRSP